MISGFSKEKSDITKEEIYHTLDMSLVITESRQERSEFRLSAIKDRYQALKNTGEISGSS